ncbi:MAG: hypothetical protein HQK49_02460 [Oligoflexia bacterium]|nr:hypothetical protein [Oligoflexia bacterium]
MDQQDQKDQKDQKGKADLKEKRKLDFLYKVKNKKAQSLEQKKRSILLLLKFDAKNLLDRVSERKIEYMYEFSLKRTREHFKEIFTNRYQKCSINILKHCDIDVLTALNNYHTRAEEILWYLNHTQDMSKTAEDKITIHVVALSKLYSTVELYLDAAIDVQSKLIEEHENTADDTYDKTDEHTSSKIPSEITDNIPDNIPDDIPDDNPFTCEFELDSSLNLNSEENADCSFELEDDSNQLPPIISEPKRDS